MVRIINFIVRSILRPNMSNISQLILQVSENKHFRQMSEEPNYNNGTEIKRAYRNIQYIIGLFTTYLKIKGWKLK